MPEFLPKVIAISGGPCAGKSTVLEYLAGQLKTAKIPHVIMPEQATAIMQRDNVRFEKLATQDRPKYMNYQRQILQATLDFIYQQKQNPSLAKGGIILLDRGPNDVFAYVASSEAEWLCKSFNMPHPAGFYSNVDKVVYMQSLAITRPDIYYAAKANNPSRHESLQKAAQTCRNTLVQWAEHPNLHIVGGGSLEQTKAAVKLAVIG